MFIGQIVFAQNPTQETLFSIFPNSPFPDNNSGVFTFSTNYSASGSHWEVDWDESFVFSNLFKFQHPTNPNQTFEMRIGKGGQVYSFKSASGEVMPPQWRNSFDENGNPVANTLPGIVNGEVVTERGNWAPWVDEIWQLVNSDQKDSLSVNNGGTITKSIVNRNFHQAGSYANNFAHRKSDLLQPFYSPILGSHYDENKQEFNLIIWPQSENPDYVYDGRSDCNDCFTDRFRANTLFYLRYKNVGNGIIQVDYVLHNFHKTRETSFFNVPFLGIRNSTFSNFFLSNPDNSFTLTTIPDFSAGTTVRNTLTNGWAGFSTTSDGTGASIGFAFAKATTGYADFRYGSALGPNNVRDTNILSYRLLKANDNYWNLVSGKSTIGRYFIVLGSSMQDVADIIANNNLDDLASVDRIDYTNSSSSPKIHYTITNDGGNTYTIVDADETTSNISFKTQPFLDSYPVFLIEASNGDAVITESPYYYSLKPYDGSTTSIKLLGYNESPIEINPKTYNPYQKIRIHSYDDCQELALIGTANSTYTNQVANPDATDVNNPNVSQINPTNTFGNAFFNLPKSIAVGEKISWSGRFYSENEGSNTIGSGRFNVRLFNKTVGASVGNYIQLGIFNKTGGSWQTESGTTLLQGTNDDANITANGGFNAMIIIAANGQQFFEPLYFDDIEMSMDILINEEAILDDQNAWMYNNYTKDFNATLNSVFGSNIETAQTTPTTNGNKSETLLKITRGNGPTSGISFALPTAFNYKNTTLKFRIFASCNTNAIANYRLQLRNSNGTEANWLNYTTTTIEENKWLEISVDLSNYINSTPSAEGLYDELYFFLNSGDDSGNSDGQIFYMDALQITALTSSWDGEVNNDWNTAQNWTSDVVPNSLFNVTLIAGQHPVIASTTAASVNTLTVPSTASLSINEGGSLQIAKTATGNITYNRTLTYNANNADGWYLMGSPVANVIFNDDFVTQNSIAINDTNRGIATYNVTEKKYEYLQGGGEIEANAGVGYTIKRGTETGNISFTGSLNIDDVTTPIVLASSGNFNLISNPYTSYINSGDFLRQNTSFLDSETLWLWNNVQKNYEAKTSGIDYTISPAQGFFIKPKVGAFVTFAKENQFGATDNFQKSQNDVPEISLEIKAKELQRFAKIFFKSEATLGFNNGLDGERYAGYDNPLDIFSQLIISNDKDYQIQSLPKTAIENSIINIGVSTNQSREIEFSIHTNAINENINVYLEDKVHSNFVKLSNADATYTTTISKDEETYGRFYLHTTAKSLSIDENSKLSSIIIYQKNKNTLKFLNTKNESYRISLFDIVGKKIVTAFLMDKVNTIITPNLRAGLYIVTIQKEGKKVSKKVILK